MRPDRLQSSRAAQIPIDCCRCAKEAPEPARSHNHNQQSPTGPIRRNAIVDDIRQHAFAVGRKMTITSHLQDETDLTQFTPRNLDRITDIACDDRRRIYGEATDGIDDFRACERIPPPETRYAAVAATANGRVVATAPTFETHLDLGPILDSPMDKIFGFIRSLIAAVGTKTLLVKDIPLTMADSALTR